MAQNQVTVSCPAGAWTQLTNADATKIAFSVLSGDVFIRFTTDTTTPTATKGHLFREGERQALATITNLTALALADRVWARPTGGRRAVVHVDTD